MRRSSRVSIATPMAPVAMAVASTPNTNQAGANQAGSRGSRVRMLQPI